MKIHHKEGLQYETKPEAQRRSRSSKKGSCKRFIVGEINRSIARAAESFEGCAERGIRPTANVEEQLRPRLNRENTWVQRR